MILALGLGLAWILPVEAAASSGRGAPVAMETASPPQAEPQRIVLAIADDAALQPEALRLTLRGHLTDLAILPEVEARSVEDLRELTQWARGRAAEGAEAVFWLVPAEAGAAKLYLVTRTAQRLYMRSLDLPEEPLETGEILGVVIRGLVSSLDARGTPSNMEEVDLPAGASASSSDADGDSETAGMGGSPGGSTRPRLTLALGYVGSTYASQLPWGNGAGVGIGLLGAKGLAATLDVSWVLHQTLTPTLGAARYDDARLRLGRAGAGLRLGYRAHLGAGRRLFVEPALAARVEALLWWPVAESRALRGAGARVGVGPAATVGVALGRGFGLAMTGGLDLWMRNLDLVAKTPAGTAPIAKPPLTGATVQVGLTYVR